MSRIGDPVVTFALFAYNQEAIVRETVLTDLIGFKGVALAHFVNYVMYLATMAAIVSGLTPALLRRA